MNIFKTIPILLLLMSIPMFGVAQDVALLSSSLQKQKTKSKTNESVSKKTPGKKRPKVLTLNPQVESKIDAFVRKNHPELKKVLTYLKQNRNNDYYRAMMQIKKTADRLESYKKRDPERHRIELKMWQTQSRITLLAAEIAVNNNQSLKNKLRAAVREENRLKIRRIELERSRIVERLKRLNEQESKIDNLKPSAIEQIVKAQINRFKPKPVKRNKNQKDRKKNDRIGDQKK